MLYHFLYEFLYRGFGGYWPLLRIFNVFQYITFRTAYATLTALILCLVLGPWLIGRLRAFQIGQHIREEGPKSHQTKAGTPTMGGVLIVVSIVGPTLLFADLRNPYIWLVILGTLAFGAIGFADDYLKIKKKRNLGLTAREKIGLQVLVSLFIGGFLLYLATTNRYSTKLTVPFFKFLQPDLVIDSLMGTPFYFIGYLPFLFFVALVIVGASNTVNLTDGLDGLAIGCTLIASAALTALTYVSGHAVLSQYLDIQNIMGVAEVTIFCGAMVGASLGFLWYNAHPAEVFMGDVGSLALGGAIGTVAVAIKQELLLVFVGGVFVIEGLSVMIQVVSFKLRGKRVFRMAPLHHHFELIGLEGVAGDHSLLDRGDDFRAVQLVDFETEMTLVVGMARSGIAAARLLKSRGQSVFVTDSGKPSLTGQLEAFGIPYETSTHTLSWFLNADEIVVSPGIPLTIPPLEAARQKGTPIVGELEIAHRYLKGDIVGITGSNGKTTTTTLVGEILKAAGRTVQVGGNIGIAMCDLVETSTAQTINVVEVSSFQLDTIREFRPAVGALLNITPDHLDRYQSFKAYRASKFRLFENQRNGDTAVINQDDPECYPPPVQLRAEQHCFSRKQPVERGACQMGDTLYLSAEPVMTVPELPLRGNHNIENVLASMAIAGRYGVKKETLAQAIRAFRGVEHRIEYVLSVRGVQFFNDSKATNVDSAIKAVESFDRNLILILGGKDKGASYGPLIQAMRGRVKHVLLIGAASEKIAAAIGDAFEFTRPDSMENAVQQGFSVAAAGDVVLLSPACASFDMFDNYEHRGRVFKEAVRALFDICQEH